MARSTLYNEICVCIYLFVFWLLDLVLVPLIGPIKMDIMWPISQSHFHVSCLNSLK